jgi:flagellar biosynthesis GTPase FlhF
MRGVYCLSMVLAVVFAVGSVAQEVVPRPRPPTPADVIAPVRPLVRTLGDLDVDGPLWTFCQTLQQELGDGVVMVAEDSIKDRPVSLSVKSVNALSVFNLLEAVAGVKVRFSSARGFMDVQNLYRLTEEQYAEVMPGGGPILLMVFDAQGGVPFGGGATGAGAPAETTRVYNITDVLMGSGLEVEDLATAVRTAWPDEVAPLRLQVHEDTGLLICRGPAEALDVVDQVLWQLEGGEEAVILSMQVRSGDLRASPNQEMQRRIQTLEQELAASREEAARRQDEARQVVRAAEDQYREMARELEQARIQAQNAQQQWELEQGAQMMHREMEYRAHAAEMEARMEAMRAENEALRRRYEEAEERVRLIREEMGARLQ